MAIRRFEFVKNTQYRAVLLCQIKMCTNFTLSTREIYTHKIKDSLVHSCYHSFIIITIELDKSKRCKLCRQNLQGFFQLLLKKATK